MAINIKNEKTCELTRELAHLTDDTMTGAITTAVQEKLEKVRRQRDKEQLLRDLRTIRERCAQLIEPGFKSTDHDDFLYDEYGLPK